MLVWIALISAASAFPQFFFFFFFSFQPQWLTRSFVNSALVHYSRIPQTLLFINFFIKNGSHSTIHTFKNYFATVFSVFSFSKISSIQTDPKSACYIIGDGTSVNVWEDPWIPGVQGFKPKPQSEDTSLTPLNLSQLLDHSTNQKKHIHTNREGERETQSALKNSHTPMSIIIGCHTHTWLCHKHTYP